MALYIDVRVNERVVATASVQNIAGEDICDYAGHGKTVRFDDRQSYVHDGIKIRQHDRRRSVWALVEKIARQIASREASEVAQRMRKTPQEKEP